MRSNVSRPNQRWKLFDCAASKHHSTIQSNGNHAAKSTQKSALQPIPVVSSKGGRGIAVCGMTFSCCMTQVW